MTFAMRSLPPTFPAVLRSATRTIVLACSGSLTQCYVYSKNTALFSLLRSWERTSKAAAEAAAEAEAEVQRNRHA
ncbi:hypothetical protein E2C01_082044 [Portunus trituberculatus]|uniref:Uncharacterized protein n=1 Tax=Portunus trituberculatus TaxID=210409 RepID=A0A5B7IY14_PORTR|nr:hypothetical protein [Portunus trituberculatus]